MAGGIPSTQIAGKWQEEFGGKNNFHLSGN
jgi:hypothetical protein